MRKKILTLLMAVALLVVSGPLDIFAAAGDNGGDADGSNTVNEMVATDPAEVTDPEEGVVPEGGQQEEATGAEDVVTETPAEAVPEEPAEEPEEEAAPLGEMEDLPPVNNINASSTTTSSITLAWDAVDEADIYKVLIGEATEGENFTEPAATITGLTPDTEYTFTVVALKEGSEIAKGSFTTKTAPKGTVANFRAISGYNVVTLAWNAFSGATYYVVTYSEGGTPNAKLYEGGGTSCSQGGFPTYDVYNTASGPVARKDFNYKVTAYDKKGGNVIAEAQTSGFPVRTMYYKLTFKKSASLTSHSGGSKKVKFRKGQVVYAWGFDGGRFRFNYKCPDGAVRTFYTKKVRVKSSIWGNHMRTGKAYTPEEAVKYVNARGIDSKKSYMIWINTYTQREYVFTGRKGNWKLVQGPWLVSTGKASKPTATGSTNINRKMKSQHGVPTWNVTRHFSIHGKNKSWVLGWPRSGACVRNYNENARWIYKTCPLKTRVFVF